MFLESLQTNPRKFERYAVGKCFGRAINILKFGKAASINPVWAQPAWHTFRDAFSLLHILSSPR